MIIMNTNGNNVHYLINNALSTVFHIYLKVSQSSASEIPREHFFLPNQHHFKGIKGFCTSMTPCFL